MGRSTTTPRSSAWSTPGRSARSEAAERGLYVTWEVEPGFAFNKPSDVLRVLDAIPDDNFGVMYDTCHGQMVAVVGARQHGRQGDAAGRPARVHRQAQRPDQPHPPDRQRQQLPQGRGRQRRDQRARAVRRGRDRLRRAGPAPRQGEARARLVDDRPLLLGQRLGADREVQARARRAEPEIWLGGLINPRRLMLCIKITGHIPPTWRI